MDPNQLEQMLKVLNSNKEGIPLEVINEYNREIVTFQMSQEGFIWLIENFLHFQSQELIGLAMSTFRLWITSNWESLTEPIIEQLKSILFTNARAYSDNPSIYSSQSSIQIGLFFYLYPDSWPTFWGDLLSLPEATINSFLTELVSSDQEKLICGIFQIGDNSEELVVSYLIDKITKGQDELYPILTQMITSELIDPTSILNSPIIAIIQSTLTQTTQEIIASPPESTDTDKLNKVDAAIKLVNCIVCTPINPELLNSFLTELKIIDIMMGIFQNECFTTIMASASSLITAAAEFFLETPAAPEYYRLSLLILQHPLMDVISPVIDFIEKFTTLSQSPDIAQQSFTALLHVLSNYFLNLSTSTDFDLATVGEIGQFASDVLKKMTTILRNNTGMIDAYLSPLIETQNGLNNSSGGLALEASEISAAFYLLVDVVHDHLQFEKKNDICTAFFIPLIPSINPPYENLQTYYAVTSYMTLIASIAEQFNSNLPYEQTGYPPIEIFQITFQQVLVNLTFAYEEEREFQKIKFQTVANQFTQSNIFTRYLSVSSDIVFGLFKTGDYEVIQVAAKLLKKFETSQEQLNVFQACMEILNQFLQSSKDKKKPIQLMLLLIQKQKSNTEKDQQLTPELMKYMEKLLPVAASDGELMSKFLDVVFDVFSQNGLPLFTSLFDMSVLNHIESVQKCCELSEKYTKVVNSFEWVTPICFKLWQSVGQLIQNVSEWNDGSEEAREGINLLQSFFSMISNLCKYLTPELNQNLLQFIGQLFPLLTKIELKKDPFCEALVFLTKLITLENGGQLYVNGLIQVFLPLTFQVFQDESFNINAKWGLAIIKIAKFHQELVKADSQTTLGQISQIWGTFPQGERSKELLEQYAAIIQLPRIDEQKPVIEAIFGYLHEMIYHN